MSENSGATMERRRSLVGGRYIARQSLYNKWGILSAVIALAVYLGLNIDGIELTPDSWAYWQGAVSISQGKGYTYFSGHPIVAWPPLYSLYLALWTSMAGPVAWSLIAANSVLVAIQAIGWYWAISTIVTEQQGDQHFMISVLVSTYIGLIVPLNTENLANTLQYTILPLLVLGTYRVIKTENAFWPCVGVCFLGCLLVVTHNASLAYIAASTAVIMLFGEKSLISRLRCAFVVAVIPISVWIVVAYYLGELGHRAVGLYEAQYSVFEYVFQAAESVGQTIFPTHLEMIGAVIVGGAVIYLWLMADKGVRFLIAFTFLSVAALIAIFSLTWVHDPLSGRFVWFVPLIVISLAYSVLGRSRPFVLAAIVVLTLPLAIERTVKWIAITHPSLPLLQAGREDWAKVWLLPLHAELSRSLPSGQAALVDGRLLVAPNPWEEPLGERE